MDKKAAGLAGVLAVSSLAAAHAAVPVQPTSRAHAYAELLKSIPNAAATLKAADAAAHEQEAQQKAPVKVQLAQYWGDGGGYYHHHHHHHDYYQQPQWYPRNYHHHHHHHHHHWQGGDWGGQ